MIDAQTLRGGRAGPTFRKHGGRGHGHTGVAVLAARRSTSPAAFGNGLKKPKRLFTPLYTIERALVRLGT